MTAAFSPPTSAPATPLLLIERRFAGFRFADAIRFDFFRFVRRNGTFRRRRFVVGIIPIGSGNSFARRLRRRTGLRAFSAPAAATTTTATTFAGEVPVFASTFFTVFGRAGLRLGRLDKFVGTLIETRPFAHRRGIGRLRTELRDILGRLLGNQSGSKIVRHLRILSR